MKVHASNAASTVAAILLAAACAGGQAPQPAGVISGKVVNSVTGQSIREASVSLIPAGQGGAVSTETDIEGRFRFEGLNPGRYTLRGSKTGFINDSFNGPPPRPLLLEPDRNITVEYKLTPRGALAGKVVDRNGEPVRKAVIACGYVNIYGAPPTMDPPTVNVTDDRGEFRIPDMPPGSRFYLQVIPAPENLPAKLGGGKIRSDLPAFYPSAGRFGEAQPVPLAPGQDATGIKITLREAPVFKVSGRLQGAVPNSRLSDLDLFLIPKAEEGAPMLTGTRAYYQALARTVGGVGAIRPDGAFELYGVERGLYDLVAVGLVGRSLESVGRVTLNVGDRDLEEVVLPINFIELTLRARAERENVNDLTCSFVLNPVDIDPTIQSVMSQQPAAIFSYDRVVPALYGLNVMCRQRGLAVKSARSTDGVSTKDILDAGLDLREVSGRVSVDVLLTGETGSVVATVKDGDAPAPGRFVTLIADPPTWGKTSLFRSGYSGDDGRAVIQNVAPGQYRVFTWLTHPGTLDPPFLSRFEDQAIKVTVRAGEQAQLETKTITLK